MARKQIKEMIHANGIDIEQNLSIRDVEATAETKYNVPFVEKLTISYYNKLFSPLQASMT